ncbi:PAS domain-containing protein [Actinoplanes regularis]|uniref:PAS domain-containing protein n=1 Tax=Actinoplanes regularis TaxID=52697 RepID=UPI0025578019|nr:PAS domain-containing sensor histidine kinase [Actinoplanes regularis]
MSIAAAEPDAAKIRPLSQSEPEMRNILNSVPRVSWIAGLNAVPEWFNVLAVDYSGGTASADEKWDWIRFIHPDDVRDVRAAAERGADTHLWYEVDCRLRRRDGRFLWHRVMAMPMADAAGRVTGWACTAANIEDQKNVAATLREAQRDSAEALALTEELLSALPVGHALVDRDLRYVRINDTLAAIHGTPVAGHLGRTVEEVIPDLAPIIGPDFRQVLYSGEPLLNREITGASPAGPGRTCRWLCSYYPVRTDGEIVGVGVVVMDITARAEAEEFRSVVMDNMAEGLYTVDEYGELISMNHAASSMLGWTEDELRGRLVHSVVEFRGDDGSAPAVDPATPAHRAVDPATPAHRAVGTATPAHRAVGTATPAHRAVGTATVTCRDGRNLPVAYSAAPLRVGPATVGGLVVVFRDITEEKQRRQREIESRHAQKLESLGRLSAGIAHEINTPIQFVGDNTRFLASSAQALIDLLLVYREGLGLSATSEPSPWRDRLERAEEEADLEYLTEEVPLAVNQSLEGIERVASLVRAMKVFSYKDAGTAAYADLNEALESTLTVARNEVKYVADVVLDLGDLPHVLCHVGDLNQVFLNLLVNAADAMLGRDGRGTITVTSRKDGPDAVITITDDGSGIPEELHKVIFEPFFTTKEVGKGTGQGLPLAHAVVVEKHGGTIELSSAPGEGTTFVLRLPVDGKPAGTGATPSV